MTRAVRIGGLVLLCLVVGYTIYKAVGLRFYPFFLPEKLAAEVARVNRRTNLVLWAQSVSRTYGANLTTNDWVGIPRAQMPPQLLSWCENKGCLGTVLKKAKGTDILYAETCWGTRPMAGFVVFVGLPPTNWVPYHDPFGEFGDPKVKWVTDRIAIWY